MTRVEKKAPKIKLSDGYTLEFIHGYFWIGSNTTGKTILVSESKTSPRQFAKAVLRADCYAKRRALRAKARKKAKP